MSVTELQNLSLGEKFQIMEHIWADLRDQVDTLDVPLSHQQLLDSRKERVSSGKTTIRDWDEVKHTIGKS